MIRAALILSVLASPALAEFDLASMTGNWQGSGSYSRGDSTGSLRCRVEIKTDGAATLVSGRCASPEGGIDIGMRIAPEGSELVARGHGVEPDTTTRIEALSGTPSANALTLRGAAPGETAAIQFLPRPEDGLRIATTRTARSGREDVSVVDFTRR